MQRQNKNQETKLRGESGEAIRRLAGPGVAQLLVPMLGTNGGVHQAAQAAAKGDASQLMEMMNQLMSTPEGARLVERISRQAKESGLT